jgi:hypothetical protein
MPAPSDGLVGVISRAVTSTSCRATGSNLVDGEVGPGAHRDIDPLPVEGEAVAEVDVVDAAVAVGDALEPVALEVVDLEGVGLLVGADHQRLRAVGGFGRRPPPKVLRIF